MFMMMMMMMMMMTEEKLRLCANYSLSVTSLTD